MFLLSVWTSGRVPAPVWMVSSLVGLSWGLVGTLEGTLVGLSPALQTTANQVGTTGLS